MKSSCRLTLGFLVGFVLLAYGRANGATPSAKAGPEYYLAPDGSDAGPGSSAHPWKSLDKANRTLKSGDTVILRAGSYAGIISPAFSGESTAKAITYRSENRHGAVLTGQAGATYILNLKDRRFITVEGIKMLPQSGGFGFVENCDHITLQNCHLEGSTKVYIALEFVKSRHTRMVDNSFTRHVTRDSELRINGNMCNFTDCSHTLIEGNSFSKIGHCPLVFKRTGPNQSDYNVIRGNCFHNGWGRNFSLQTLGRTLFENNVVTDAFDGARSADSTSKVFLVDGIFRNNVIYDNWGVVLVTRSYVPEGKEDGDALECKNSRFYNNTFANNPAFAWEMSVGHGGAEMKSNVFSNNLFFRNDYAGNFNAIIATPPEFAKDNPFQNNLFFGEKPGQAAAAIAGKRYLAAALNRNLAPGFGSNFDADPRFVSLQNDCFALSEGSPAIDTGRWLTRAVGAGTGREVPVEDARYFFDGFGIEGEQGDVIAVGATKQLVRVLKSDIAKNVLTLDQEVTWKEGDPVSLPYAGKAPDIGAFQHGETGVFNAMPRANPVMVKPGTPISFSALTSGAKGLVQYRWDFGDGALSSEAKPVHTYRQDNDYVVRLRCTDASGATTRGLMVARVHQAADPKAPMMQTDFEERNFEEWAFLWDRRPRKDNNFRPVKRDDGKGQCMSVFAEGKTQALAINAKMHVWNIDQYPYVSFSYRIPKGTPVGVWINAWPTADKMEGICVGGSAGNSAGRFPNVNALKLVDDGQWHTAVFDARVVRKAAPDFKLAYAFEFTTFAKVTEGQKFWFDDFAITPSPPDGTGGMTTRGK
jgi:hypothetical protein